MEETPETPEEHTGAALPEPILPNRPAGRSLGIRIRTFITTRRKPLIAAAGVIFAGLIGYSVYATQSQLNRDPACDGAGDCAAATPTPSIASITPTASSSPIATSAAALDGVLVPEGEENLHPLAVMIENHPDARPQFGLGQANLVYEAIAEGGITRFMAVFRNPSLPVKVGPVRSARPYFVDFATELNAFYAHVGGNATALTQIKNTGVLDLDQFAIGAPTYQRESRAGVGSEHTMFSSTDALWRVATVQKHWSTTGDYPTWTFVDDPPQNTRPATQQIRVEVSTSSYHVRWTYDPATNSYLRTMGGSAHTDPTTGKQISAKNIIIQNVARTESTSAIGEHGWLYTLTGSGSAKIIQNGTVTEATWRKEGTGRTRYYRADGSEITFVRGTTWVHLTHSDSVIAAQ